MLVRVLLVEVTGSLHNMSITLISSLAVQSTVVPMERYSEVSGKAMMSPLRTSRLDF